MINLLPTSTKEDMTYARKNSALLRWTFVLALALLGVGLIVASGTFYLMQTAKTYEKRSADAKLALQSQNIEDTQKKVDEISNNVKLTNQVLGREILFSKLIKQLGSALPQNTSLQQLQIDSVKGGINLSAASKDIDSGTQIQVNLQDPKNQIFEKADIDSISCEQASEKAYPCTVQIRALFAKNNPFLYITPTATGAKQ